VREEDIIAYANRDWAGNEHSKRRWIAEESAKLTPGERLARGDRLRCHAHTIHPDWPTAEHRRADLESHLRLLEMLRRVQPERFCGEVRDTARTSTSASRSKNRRSPARSTSCTLMASLAAAVTASSSTSSR